MSRHLCTDKCDTGKRKTGNRKTGKPVSGNLLRSLTLTLLLPGGSFAGESLLLQSTTSTANSGLYDFLLPKFKEQSGVQVHVVAVGTGQAIRNATNCDGDVLLVHAKAAEEKFVADGVLQALQKIADTTSVFASRGDNSGTHKKELTLWQSATVDTAAGNGRWYRETGAGMGATLNTAVGMGAYTLTDRATWLSFKNRQNQRVLFEGDQQLFNQYGVIQVNPERCPNVKADTGQQFIAWLTGEDGQRLIGEYAVNGEQLFYPNAK